MLRSLNNEQYIEVIENYSDEALMEFFGYANSEELVKEKERYKGGLTMFNKSFFFFHMVEKVSGKTVGWCGYHTWYIPHQRAEIGYTIYDPANRNKGFMKEALPLVLAYGFDKMGLNRIEAFTSPENNISMNLLLKNGFEREGLLREHYKSEGAIGDSVVFGLLRKDYPLTRS